MKRFWTLTLALLMVFTLSACGGDPAPVNSPAGDLPQASDQLGEDLPTVPTPKAGSQFVFTYKDCPLPMNAEFGPLLDYIGQPDSYFEAASCAFDGLDKTYTYGQIEILTYPDEEKAGVDYISSLRLLDGSVSTPEGISIGDKASDVVAAYGNDYDDLGNQYSYLDGDTFLNFLLDGDTVISIEYIAINDLLA